MPGSVSAKVKILRMEKRQILGIIGIALVWFLVQLIVTIPAGVIVKQVNAAVPNVHIVGASGSIWNGSAHNVIVKAGGQNQEFGKTSWELHGLPLMLGSFAMDISAKNDKQSIEGLIKVGMGGSVTAENLNISLPAKMAQQFSPLPLDLEGQFELMLKEVAFANQQVSALKGSLTWQNAAAGMGIAPIKLGNYLAELSLGAKGEYIADLSDLGGSELGISGRVSFEPTQRQYNVDARLKMKPSINPQLKGMLMGLGKPNPQGEIEVKQSGKV